MRSEEQSHRTDPPFCVSPHFPLRHQQARGEGLPPHPSLWEYIRGGYGYLRWSVNATAIRVIPPTQRHISGPYPSHCSILLWIWSCLSCTLLVILVWCAFVHCFFFLLFYFFTSCLLFFFFFSISDVWCNTKQLVLSQDFPCSKVRKPIMSYSFKTSALPLGICLMVTVVRGDDCLHVLSRWLYFFSSFPGGYFLSLYS